MHLTWNIFIPINPALIWGLFISISPAIALFCYFYEKERNQNKYLATKVELFLLGITALIPIFIIESILDVWLGSGKFSNYISSTLNNESYINIPWPEALFMGFIWSATVEESIKLIYIFFWSRKFKLFKDVQETITYTVFLSLGFASIENIIYIFSYHQNVPILNLATGRAFMSLPMHLLAAVAMGFRVWQYKLNISKSNRIFLFKAWGTAILIHGTYNTLLFSQSLLGSFLAILLVIVGAYKAFQLIKNINQSQWTLIKELMKLIQKLRL